MFIRLYHVKHEEKAIPDKEMKKLCYLGFMKEVFFSIFENSYID